MAKKNPNTTEQELLPVETHRRDLNTPAYLFAAARQMHGWPQGRRLLRTEYEKAIKAAGEERLG